MQRVDVGHKLNIHGYKVIVTFLLVAGLAGVALAQQEVKMYGKYTGDVNLPHYDDKLFHFGFTIGVNTSRVVPTLSNQYFGVDTITAIKPQNSGGFSLGFIVNYRIADHWDL